MPKNLSNPGSKVKTEADYEAISRNLNFSPTTVSHLKFTPEKKEQFIQHLRETGGNISVAAKRVGISRSTANKHINDYEDFALAVQEAMEEAIDHAEDAVYKRGIEGIPKGVYFQGKRVDEEIQYSDQLALRWLEANRPEKWSTKSSVAIKGEVDVNVSEAKSKLLDLLKIDPSEIEEGDFTTQSS